MHILYRMAAQSTAKWSAVTQLERTKQTFHPKYASTKKQNRLK